MQDRSEDIPQKSKQISRIIAKEISKNERSPVTSEEKINANEHIEKMSVELLKLSQNLNSCVLVQLLSMTVQEARAATKPRRIDIARL
jgi:hypothetical protein